MQDAETQDPLPRLLRLPPQNPYRLIPKLRKLLRQMLQTMQTTQPPGGVFKIGGTAPLTGAAAIYGNAVKNGAQIAVDEINAEGGAVQFDLKYEDDENDPEKAVSAYNALKDWGVQLSLGSVTTKPCEATSTDHFADRYLFLNPFRIFHGCYGRKR